MEKIFTEEDLRFAVKITRKQCILDFLILFNKKGEYNEKIKELNQKIKEEKDLKCPMNKPLCLTLESILKNNEDI